MLVDSRRLQALNPFEQGDADHQHTAASEFRLSCMVRCIRHFGLARFLMLVFAAIVCSGRHPLCRLLRIAGALAEGHWSTT